MDYNTVFISGVIVREPEYFLTSNNQPILKLNIQVKDRKIINYFNVVVFGSLGEKYSKILKKGDLIFVEGRLRYSRFQTKTGAVRSKVDIIADRMHKIYNPKELMDTKLKEGINGRQPTTD